MTERSDSSGRTEGLAPVHYLFGAGPSGSGRDAPEDGNRWFDPELDGEEGFLDGAAQPDSAGAAPGHDSPSDGSSRAASPRGSWASQTGGQGVRALRPVDETPDARYGRPRGGGSRLPSARDGAAADGGASDGAMVEGASAHGAEDARRERDEERRRLREERAAERTARRAENVAMHALTRRGQSVQEMRDLLTARELDADEIESEIQRLEGVGLLDDAELAGNLVRSLTERKKLGRSALLAELRRRKLDPIVIEEAVAELDRDDEDDRCLELARQRARQLNSVDDQTAERRLSAFLQRKGYSGDAIRKSVKVALRDERGVRFV